MRLPLLPLFFLLGLFLGPRGGGAAPRVLDLGEGETLELVEIPAGSFLMGSGAEIPDEAPRHAVTFAQHFLMGRTEVTQAQWKAVMGSSPSYFTGPRLPVEQVSWVEAGEFCARVTELTGREVRLPSEAEWEYACRADTSTRFSFGDDAGQLTTHAWLMGNSGGKTHEVASREANPWGLFDMHGNVFEWCLDTCHEGYEGAPTKGEAWIEGADPRFPGHRILRGGSWTNPAYTLRSAYRSQNREARGNRFYGFRVVVPGGWATLEE